MVADVDRRHLVILNIAESDLPPEPTWSEVRALRRQKPGMLVLAPHPFYPHPCCLGKSMDDHVDCIDAVEWCILHVGWLPGRVNPNLRATRWAQKHGKTVVACSDAHSLAMIGKNASTVEADELTPEALWAGIRAGRVTFHRKSIELVPLISASGKAAMSLPKHTRRWIQAKLGKRRAPALGSPATSGVEVVP
jgi:predicted metal-dependent phosphoesterase TrpH